jgi:CheY-like chemotaxis protein
MNQEFENVSILLVEDSQVDIDLTLMAFSRINFEKPVQIVRDGAETLEIIDQWKKGIPLPYLVLLDINIPKVNGLEVLHAIKSSAKTRHIPVVMLTSSTNEADLRTAYEYGANSYIIKPVDFEEFKTLTMILCDYWIRLNIQPEDKR